MTNDKFRDQHIALFIIYHWSFIIGHLSFVISRKPLETNNVSGLGHNPFENTAGCQSPETPRLQGRLGRRRSTFHECLWFLSTSLQAEPQTLRRKRRPNSDSRPLKHGCRPELLQRPKPSGWR